MSRSTSTTFSVKLTFPNKPTFNDPPSSARATSTSTIKREVKGKPRHSDNGLEVESGRAPDRDRSLMAGRSWMMDKS